MGKNIIVDTNMLFVPIREKFELFKELSYNYPSSEIVVLKDSIDELEKLDKKGVSDAKIAKENILKQGIRIVDVGIGGDVDSKIVAYAKKHNAFIVTSDKTLKERAKKAGLSCLAFYKSRKKLVVA